MILNEKIQALFETVGEDCEVGRLSFERRGWLRVLERDDVWHVEYREAQDDHGPAMAVDFDKVTGQPKKGRGLLTGAWLPGSIIRPANPLEAPRIYRELESHINHAYEHNCE